MNCIFSFFAELLLLFSGGSEIMKDVYEFQEGKLIILGDNPIDGMMQYCDYDMHGRIFECYDKETKKESEISPQDLTESEYDRLIKEREDLREHVKNISMEDIDRMISVMENAEMNAWIDWNEERLK